VPTWGDFHQNYYGCWLLILMWCLYAAGTESGGSCCWSTDTTGDVTEWWATSFHRHDPVATAGRETQSIRASRVWLHTEVMWVSFLWRFCGVQMFVVPELELGYWLWLGATTDVVVRWDRYLDVTCSEEKCWGSFLQGRWRWISTIVISVYVVLENLERSREFRISSREVSEN